MQSVWNIKHPSKYSFNLTTKDERNYGQEWGSQIPGMKGGKVTSNNFSLKNVNGSC